MKITKKNDREFRTVYMVDGKIAMHLYTPGQDINKKNTDYLCYIHDRMLPGVNAAKLTVKVTDNPNKKKRGDKEKFGKMFRCATVKEAYTAINAIAKALPQKEEKKPAPKKNTVNARLVEVKDGKPVEKTPA